VRVLSSEADSKGKGHPITFVGRQRAEAEYISKLCATPGARRRWVKLRVACRRRKVYYHVELIVSQFISVYIILPHFISPSFTPA
jgi:hypothetical protein